MVRYRALVVGLSAAMCVAIVASRSGGADAAVGVESTTVQWLGEIAVEPALALPTKYVDAEVEAAQAVTSPAPLRRNVRASTTASRSALRTTAAVGLASVPYMIGDTGSGTCLGIDGLVQAQLSHPTLTCGRLNIAEGNTAIPIDRLYYSYRHFHNASKISAYQFSEVLDIDRHLIGWERTFWDGGASVELRLPIEQRIRSDIFSLITPAFGVVDPLVAPGDGRQTELGNIAGIFKYLLWEDESVAVSGGLGVTLPTARDVDYRLAVNGFVTFPNTPGIIAYQNAAFQGVFGNETVYLEPFLAWLVHPSERLYHQGFLQVETAANPSRVTFAAVGATDFYQEGNPNLIGFYDYVTPTPVRADIFAQPLLRLNLGAGYLLVDNPRARFLQQATAIFEMHYTTTLADANLTDIPLSTQASAGTVPLQTITMGNGDNRVDILNAAAGVSFNLAGWTVTNGCIAPIRRMPDRGFDFEYNTQVQRAF